MTVYKTIIRGSAEPQPTDLWIKEDEEKNLSLNIMDNGEWKSLGGGGGDATDAIKFTEQSLTDAQKMQARKNQGLYYKEGGEATISWEGDTTGKENLGPFYKVSPDVPQIDGLKTVTAVMAGVTQTYEFGEDVQVTEIAEGLFGVALGSNPLAFICTVPEATLDGETITEGTWVVYMDSNNYVYELVYDSQAISKIPSEYIPITSSLSAFSTNNEVPGAKAVYDIVGDVETLLADL